MNFWLYAEPLILPLDMEYHLNVVKEINVIEAFLSMDENIRQCQEESYDDCAATFFKDALLNKCQCLPFRLKLSEEVSSN